MTMKNFSTKSAAIDHLKNNPLSCVSWGKECAIYWNGRIKVTATNSERKWC